MRLTVSRPLSRRACIPQLVDQMLIATRFRLRDAWMTELFSLVYVIFNIAYYFSAPRGEKIIYYILDWGRKPGLACAYTLVTLLVLVPLFDLVHYGLFR